MESHAKTITFSMNEQPRKRTFEHMHLAKIQISLRIRAFWPESSLSAFWITKDEIFFHGDNEDSD